MSVEHSLIIIAALLLIGLLSEEIYKKFSIPTSIPLILIGIVIGPAVLNLVDFSILQPLIEPILYIIVIIILFFAGLELHFSSLVREGIRGIIQAFLCVSLAFTSIFILTFFVLKFSLIESMFLGIIIGGETSTVLFNKIQEKFDNVARNFLLFETTMNSIIMILIFFTLIELITGKELQPIQIITNFTSEVFNGIMIGILFGILWLRLLKFIIRHDTKYVLTLVFLLLASSISFILKGSPFLTALIFGVMVRNEREIGILLRIRAVKYDEFIVDIKNYQKEIDYIINTFFFISLGLAISTIGFKEISLIFFSIIIAFLLLIIRYISLTISTFKFEINNEINKMLTMVAQGITPPLLAFTLLSYKHIIINAENILLITGSVVLLTNIIALYFIFRYKK